MTLSIECSLHSLIIAQIIIEKLLRDCPDVKTLYFLARGRKGASAEQRVSELLDSQVGRLCLQCWFVECLIELCII